MKDDAMKKKDEDRKWPNLDAIAQEWAKEKRSRSKRPSDEVKAVDECRQVTTNFFKNAYMLLEKGLVDRDVFKESYYARSGNFKKLVEPLDKANFTLVCPNQNYTDGNNRPQIYKKIELAQKDPELKEFF